MFDAHLRPAIELQNHFQHPPNTLAGYAERGATGLIQLLSTVGSGAYVIGSVYFIPEANNMVLGTWLFIYGSAVIVVAQATKLWRGTDDAPQIFVESGKALFKYQRWHGMAR